jgi:non-specific serine/threonine protein kinase
LAGDRHQYAQARKHYEESLQRFRKAGELHGVATSLTNLGIAADLDGDHAAACSFHEQSLGLYRQLGNERGIQSCLNNLGSAAAAMGDLDRAKACHEERLVLVKQQGDEWGVGITLNNLSVVARDRNQLSEAAELSQESLQVLSRFEDKWGVASALYNLATIRVLQGQWSDAVTACRDALLLFDQLHATAHEGECIRQLARVAIGTGHPGAAATLLGAAETRAVVPESEVRSVRAHLDPAAFEEARTAGHNLAITDAISIAIEAAAEPRDLMPARTERRARDGLTRREREVLVLVAGGLTNRQIAERLFISERTAESHVASILGRLGLSTRSEAAVWAVGHGLMGSQRS